MNKPSISEIVVQLGILRLSHHLQQQLYTAVERLYHTDIVVQSASSCRQGLRLTLKRYRPNAELGAKVEEATLLLHCTERGHRGKTETKYEDSPLAQEATRLITGYVHFAAMW
jgi:hypothetical protein